MIHVVDVVSVDDHPELAAVAVGQRRLGDALDEPLVAQPVVDEVGDRDDLEAVQRSEASRSGMRAIVPSSFMISQITPAGFSPASRARSTEASVWPARPSTPPLRARSGKM